MDFRSKYTFVYKSVDWKATLSLKGSLKIYHFHVVVHDQFQQNDFKTDTFNMVETDLIWCCGIRSQ